MALGTQYIPAPVVGVVGGGNNTAINATDDTAVLTPMYQGLVVQDQLGNWYRYHKNGGTVYAVSDLLTASYAQTKTDKGPTEYKLHVTADGSLPGPYALALNAITASQFGWALIVGVGVAHVKGVVALGDALASSAVTALKVVKIADAAPPPISMAVAVEVTAGDADASIRMLGNNL